MFLIYRYFFSWRDPTQNNVEKDWLDARNYCRQRCMDSVSVETSPENEWVKQRIVDGKVSDKWFYLVFNKYNEKWKINVKCAVNFMTTVLLS